VPSRGHSDVGTTLRYKPRKRKSEKSLQPAAGIVQACLCGTPNPASERRRVVKPRNGKKRRASSGGMCHGEVAPRPVPTAAAWLADDGCHLLLPGIPSPELLDEISRNFQEQLRRSPLWKELVQQYGPERAEQILQQCRAQLA
jgi:hypothetical protein